MVNYVEVPMSPDSSEAGECASIATQLGVVDQVYFYFNITFFPVPFPNALQFQSSAGDIQFFTTIVCIQQLLSRRVPTIQFVNVNASEDTPINIMKKLRPIKRIQGPYSR